MRSIFLTAVVFGAGILSVRGQGDAPPPPSTDDLYKVGRELFDQFAPPDVKRDYEFPSKAEFDAFMGRLQSALDEGSLRQLADYEPQARAALVFLRTLPDQGDLADWLSERLDELDVARQITQAAAPGPQPGSGAGAGPRGTAGGGRGPGAEPAPESNGLSRPATPAAPMPGAPLMGGIPFYSRWVARERTTRAPTNAVELMPRLRRAFVAEGVPPEVAWIAEAESSLNPSARSPAGARGLFQLLPGTAHDLGLSTFLPDERNDPEKSAHAAARDLRKLKDEFGSWPLAFAAYNAGAGRLRRLMSARHAGDFAGVADALPGETRMYVPKVCALIAVRAGVAPENIGSPAPDRR